MFCFNIFNCFKKRKYMKIKKSENKETIQTLSIYNQYIEETCECEKLGPPVIGTCNICGAWQVY